ncbi:glycosyltransferase [Gardnerella vaginalis]|uniref:Glycosyl transferase family 2 n=1 Tax=Gardnerella vaginalis TaxID=2702 RepID=A0A2K1SUX0_GARVA|nr:glycosyltransferase [Gardnerella vaginalis]PNS43333.1 glycosyl transferase family 2 [Gardnerella vaginalis]
MTKAKSAENRAETQNKQEMQEKQDSNSANSNNKGWEVVNRVVYPVKDTEITMPLYVIPWHRSYLQRTVLDPRMNTRAIDINNLNLTDFKKLLADTSSHLPNVETQDVCTVLSRNSLCIDAGKHVSLCTFFNAFPASYWQHWTRVKTVKFTANVEGTGYLQLMRSTGRGLTYPVQKFEFNSNKQQNQPEQQNQPAQVTQNQSAQTISYEIPMTGLADGGYFWFEAKASDSSCFTVSNAEWSVPCANKVQSGKQQQSNSTFSIAITTFNRPSYCHNQLKAIAENTALRARLDTIYCTDQGTDLVKNQPGFNETSANLGNQLTYIQQANLGGSGGFSRGMFETLKAGKSSYTMLLDDDAISETECILRALQFADYTIKPAIIGGGMLHLDNRTVLYTQGERFTRNNVWMKPSQNLDYNHDFAAITLQDCPERHQRIDTDYNGWWMSLIPTAIMKEIGLSLPVFIKFDDTEYSIRALEHGYHTICLPGVAVWHQAWHDKDPSRTWEEYFFQRNRWICGLLHCTKPSLRFAIEMLRSDLASGLKLAYSAMHLHHMGLQDILRGPQYIVDSMPQKLGEVRKARQSFSDTQPISDESIISEVSREHVSPFTAHDAKALRKAQKHATIKALLAHEKHKKNATSAKNPRPEVAIPAQDVSWPSFVGVNTAIVTAPDGTTLNLFQRDSKLFRKLLRTDVFLALKMLRRWKKLSKAYRAYDMASVESWDKIFSSTNNK